MYMWLAKNDNKIKINKNKLVAFEYWTEIIVKALKNIIVIIK